MKLRPISKDTSADTFNIKSTSLNNHYPILQINADEIDVIKAASTLSSLATYKELDFAKILNFEALKDITDNFYTDFVRSSISSRLKVQAEPNVTHMVVDGTNTTYARSTSYGLTNSQVEEVKTKALDLGYIDEPSEGFSTREVTDYHASGEPFTKSISLSEKYLKREDNYIESIYSEVENLEEIWGKIREVNLKDSIISLDLSKTLGSVVPVFGDIEFEEGYTTLSATVIFKEANAPEIYKESFNIYSKSTACTNLTSGVQLIWALPNTINSVVKVVWDPSIIEMAKITNIKLSKINSNE